MAAELTIIRPDDWHLHFRDVPVLADVVPHTARRFGRAIIMPNLVPPVRTTQDARCYRQRVMAAVPAGSKFTPLMTLYLTDTTPPAEIALAIESGHVFAVKMYPAGATTNSDSGVTDLENVSETLEAMAGAGMPLLIHGEVTDRSVDVFDRERAFIDTVLEPLVRRYPELKIVFEHITTSHAVEFVQMAPATVAATITAHHLLDSRNALFDGGLRPHHYCLPVLKRESHRLALIEAATGGDQKFFLGTDSAPHPRSVKEAACGCAGIYTAAAGIELYAEAFDAAGALDRLEAFASLHGPSFYGLEPNTETLTLVREPWVVPDALPLAGESLVPYRAGCELAWAIAT